MCRLAIVRKNQKEKKKNKKNLKKLDCLYMNL